MEKWKDIVGFEGYYQVSNLGRVRSLDRAVQGSGGWDRPLKGKVLKQSLNKQGYLVVSLSKGNKNKRSRVHRIVAQAFKKNTKNKPQVNHKNGIKTDNRSVNLEWCTCLQNKRHAKKLGLVARGSKTGSSLITEDKVLEICNLLDNGKEGKYIANKYGISESTVAAINTGRNWNWLTNRRKV